MHQPDPRQLAKPYLRTALSGLVLFAMAAPFLYPLAQTTYFHNRSALTLVHLFVLGFGIPAANGILLLLIPVRFGGRLASGKPFVRALCLHVLGTLLLIAGFWHWWPLLMAVGGGLVVAGQTLHAHWLWAAVPKDIKKRKHRDPAQLIIHDALMYLAATVLLGLVLTLNHALRMGFNPLHALGVHAILGGVGWFSNLIVGIHYSLRPVPIEARACRSGSMTSVPHQVLRLVHAGLLLITLAAFIPSLSVIGWLGMGLLSAAWALFLRDLFRKRDRPGELRLLCLYPTMVILLTVSMRLPMPGVWFHPGWVVGVSVLFTCGWIGGALVALLARTGAGGLPSRGVASIAHASYHTGVLGMALGAFAGYTGIGRASAVVWALSAVYLALVHWQAIGAIAPSYHRGAALAVNPDYAKS